MSHILPTEMSTSRWPHVCLGLFAGCVPLYTSWLLGSACLLMLMWVVNRGQPRALPVPGWWFVVGLILWPCVTQFIGPYPGAMLEGIGEAYPWIITPLLVALLCHPAYERSLLRGFMVGLALAVTLQALQWYFGFQRSANSLRIVLEGPRFDRTTGFQYRTWIMAFISGGMILALLPFLKGRQILAPRWVLWFALALAITSLLMSSTRGVMVALSVAVIPWLWVHTRRRPWQLALAASLLLGLWLGSTTLRPNFWQGISTAGMRTPIWDCALALVAEEPLTGHGRVHWPDRFRSLAHERYQREFPQMRYLSIVAHPHSDPLMWASWYGLPALFCYLGWFVSFAWFLWQHRNSHPKEALWGLCFLLYIGLVGQSENYWNQPSSMFFIVMGTALVVARIVRRVAMPNASDTQSAAISTDAT